MSRKFFVGGNWKLNGSKAQIKDLVEKVNEGVAKFTDKAEVVVAPPFVYLEYVQHLVAYGVVVSAQNASSESKGAFTGEISAEMIKDIGVHWVILGHSERRTIFHEDSQLVAKKVQHALAVGLSVILCVGEQLSEREAGKTKEVVFSQLDAVAEHVKDWTNIVIAYEPVWAIGTGKTASPAQAQEVHHQIRTEWAHGRIKAHADTIRIIYGGSVKADNANELSTQEDIDGFLVGGASLIPNDFVAIVSSVTKKTK